MADSSWKRCARCGALITGDLFYLKGTGWLGQCCVRPTGDGAFMIDPTARQEAEQIVDRVYEVASGISGEVATDADPHDRLVDALAATIEMETVIKDLDLDRDDGALARASTEILTTLSALRKGRA